MFTNKEQERDNFCRRIIKSAFWLFSTKYFSQGLNWVTTIIVARLLSPEDYGMMGMAMIYIGIMDSIHEFGFGAAIIQKINLNEDELSSSYWFLLFMSIVISVFTLMTAGLVANFFENEKLKNILRVLSIGFIINGLKIIPYNVATKELKFDLRSKAEMISEIIGATTVLAFALAGIGVWSLVFGYLMRTFSLTVLIQIMFKWRPRLIFQYNKVREITKFGLTVTSSRLIWIFSSQVDYLIIAKLFGDIPLGYYSMAKNLASAPIEKITTILLQIMYPAFSKVQNDKAILVSYFRNTNRLIAGIIFPILAGVLLIADDVIPILLKEKWIPMIPFLKIFCISGMFSTIAIICSPMLMAIKKTNVEVKYQFFKTLLMSVSFLFGSLVGPIAVALVYITIYPCLSYFFIKITLNEIKMKHIDYFDDLKCPVFKTAAMLLLVIVTSHFLFSLMEPIQRIFLNIILGICSYSILTLKWEFIEVKYAVKLVFDVLKKKV